jgi:small subunit ribosomal protein S6
MTKYEIMYILKANLGEAECKAEIEKVHKTLTDHGAVITNVNEWGVREFAYLLKEEAKGYYVVLDVEAEPESLKEFTRLAKLNPNMLRNLITVRK